jgi:hypothetical protein
MRNDVESIGSGSFVLPSTFVAGNTVTLAEGASTTKTLRVTAVGAPTNGDELQTTTTASDAPNHGDVTSGETAVTTINLACLHEERSDVLDGTKQEHNTCRLDCLHFKHNEQRYCCVR